MQIPVWWIFFNRKKYVFYCDSFYMEKMVHKITHINNRFEEYMNKDGDNS